MTNTLNRTKKGNASIMGAIFEAYAYAVILGIIAISSAIIYIFRVFGIGDHYFVSPLIGVVIGVVIVLISPMAYIAAFIVSGIATIASSFFLERVW